ncbi:MAG: DUF1343 domain-containing protein [Deltaproteobacteria bacterium]|nr:MAG: DUF1343 domain-containing protein [Deltaproteobacteria bacterium]
MVKTGLVRAIDEGKLKGLRVGAICNPTSVDAKLRHLADLLHQAEGVKLAALFGPEHGVRGDVQYLEEVHGTVDPRTGVPEHSLYGQDFASLTPRDEHLQSLDALVFDIQDVGSRYYTYLATMGLCMQAAERNGLRFVVLDRPNPIGGASVEGGVVHEGFESFVGLWPIAARHGLTAGECALLLKGEFGIDCDLDVIEMDGWLRDMLFDQTGLPWILPSPNMPTLDTALVYPGLCLLEGTNEAVRLGVACIVHARAQDPAKFAWRTEKYEFVETIPAIDLLAGSEAFRRGVEAGKSVTQLCDAWDAECDAFVRTRSTYLLY